MGQKFLGVELAPLNVPLDRRLQTLAAFFSTYLFFFGGITSITLFGYLFFCTRFWWIPLLYLLWLYYDRRASSTGGHRCEYFRRIKLHQYLRDFFPIQLIKTADLNPAFNYILGYHPHGVMSVGTINFATEATGFSEKFPGITSTVLTLKLLHFLPLYRDWLSLLGYCDVSKESINYIFKSKGNAVVIVIGGARESLDANPHMTTVVLKDRKGFVKMALKHGAHLVPVYSFGENDIFQLVMKNEPGSLVRRIQRIFQQKAGFAPLIVVGRGIFNYTFGIVPYRVPINTVVGEPIPVERDENPSNDKIDNLHTRYMKSLADLFDKHKAQYGYGETNLEFVD